MVALIIDAVVDQHVAVIFEVDRIARRDILGSAIVGADVPATVGDFPDDLQLIDVHRIGAVNTRRHVGDALTTGIDTGVGHARAIVANH